MTSRWHHDRRLSNHEGRVTSPVLLIILLRSISTKGVICNCISAIDGYLVKTITPTKKLVGNVWSYFSGHYQCYGMNVQAACDAFCRFQFIAVAGPGCMPDDRSVYEVALGTLSRDFQMGLLLSWMQLTSPQKRCVLSSTVTRQRLKRTTTSSFMVRSVESVLW